eukprot:scaffold121340_cov25-Tisochrysis_lutea.AAC.1
MTSGELPSASATSAETAFPQPSRRLRVPDAHSRLLPRRNLRFVQEEASAARSPLVQEWHAGSAAGEQFGRSKVAAGPQTGHAQPAAGASLGVLAEYCCEAHQHPWLHRMNCSVGPEDLPPPVQPEVAALDASESCSWGWAAAAAPARGPRSATSRPFARATTQAQLCASQAGRPARE